MSRQEMQWLWLWNGRCFGYRRDDGLFTADGRQVGRFVGARIFDIQGRYLGELAADSLASEAGRAADDAAEPCRLISRLADAGLHHDSFPPMRLPFLPPQPDRPELPLPPGFKRFPSIGELHRYLPAAPQSTSAVQAAGGPAEAGPLRTLGRGETG